MEDKTTSAGPYNAVSLKTLAGFASSDRPRAFRAASTNHRPTLVPSEAGYFVDATWD